ncbi:virion morphogenesis protein [Yersinia pseudotuberculosis]|uniref:phage head morphogenesis protein n=1 Tax=Yersinia pseudotuberculosis complex TaxID=1649845 RepID=UPI00061C6FE5|nr:MULTISPECIES: phage minor head protein [Yersinia pseudotuberculosis complex]MBO1554569.1 hypothetical protein [Yersinia pseudotuberculosis]CNC37688.1 Phage Mu protein F like protein [Yersinia similis]CRY70835.1 Phage Mu protein F like protein [Yersinia pseudotuberculosis]SUQ18065.1 Phage Mu protein F like protein [Yersinia pseudotuberculosis]BCU88716.1 virion morphogenesis protein [Yersinia pseudotuberculosis]
MVAKGKFGRYFQQQSDFFARKLALPSERWDDLKGAEHDHGFIVAGAMKADLVNDLKATIQQAIDQGKSIQWFRQQGFDAAVEKHGWRGWTGEGSKAGKAWRTRTIYSTNLKTSYMAGRYAQMTDPEVLVERPYWRYVHSGAINPRVEHQAWHGLILPADDPWWQTHMPPNGFGCGCDVETLSNADLKKYQKTGPDTAPTGRQRLYINQNTGEQRLLPQGISPGFDYQPGRSATEVALQAQRQKLEKLDTAIARKNIAALVNSDAFLKFWSGQIRTGEFPLAVLPDRDRQALKAGSPVVLLSQTSLMEHRDVHPDIGYLDYMKIQKLIDQGQVWQTGQNNERLAYITTDGITYKAVLKRTLDGQKNYFLTLYRDERKKPPYKGQRIR